MEAPVDLGTEGEEYSGRERRFHGCTKTVGVANTWIARGSTRMVQESLYQRLSSVGSSEHLGKMSHVHVIVFESSINAEKFLP